ncbi:unnamed protein product [Symbiodinium pilosum]|uniref:Uncharacterized protein n=1 Tax=Symbiodinium pilosum TaxID=2952 RepID=A0A812YEI3_SYMPI|nr:unnamed protein product [Symbiodinium pilosum]
MMWLDKDQAWQHVVYEHPRDADTDTILDQFQCRSSKAKAKLAEWKALPPEKKRGCVLVHNASVRRILVTPRLVSHISGQSDSSSSGDWTQALDHHPLGNVMKKAFTLGSYSKKEDSSLVIAPQRLAVVPLPPKPDTNWGWKGHFAYGDTKVGDCAFREGGVFSFISVDCGLRVGDREGDGRSRTLSDFKCEDEDLIQAKLVGEVAATDIVINNPDDPEKTGDEPTTTLEVSNCTDEPVQVKIFEPGHSHAASRLFRSAMAEGTISPATNRVFTLKASKEGVDTDLDVEAATHNRQIKIKNPWVKGVEG